MASFTHSTSGIVLGNEPSATLTATTPVTIVAGGYVSNTTGNYNGDAIYANSGANGYHGSTYVIQQPWTIANFATLVSTYQSGSSGAGVYLAAGGTVTNAGVIAAPHRGVAIKTTILVDQPTGHNAPFWPQEVVNSGKIISTYTKGNGAGVYLQGRGLVSGSESSGTVTNQAGGLITSYLTGVNIFGEPGTVSNAGTIASTGTAVQDSAIFIAYPGVVTNTGMIASGWVGLGFGTGGRGTVTNTGTIVSTADFIANGNFFGDGINLAGGGVIANGSTAAANALIQGYEQGVYLGGVNGNETNGALGTLANYGTIATIGAGRLAAAAVFLEAGNTVINHGTIVSNAGNAVFTRGTVAGATTNFGLIESFGTAVATMYSSVGGSITNVAGGQIISPNRTAVSFNDTAGRTVSFGTVTNAGTIQSRATGTVGSGVYFGQGGIITNQAGGLIAAYRSVVVAKNATATVANSGSIVSTGATFSGIYLGTGGTITNTGGITGATGIIIGPAATADSLIVDSGTITGTGGIAILLGANYTEVSLAAGAQLGGAIGNFRARDSIDLSALSFSTSGTVNLGANNELQVSENGTNSDIALNPVQSFTGNNFHLQSDGASGTLVTMGLDVLWHSPSTGDTGYWITSSSGQVTGFADFGDGSTAYSIVGVGGFDSSGTPEILWQNAATGDTGYWTINASGQVTGFNDFGDGSTAFSIVGIGDFDAAGHSEVLWEDAANGDTGYWTMNSSGQVTGFDDLGDGSTAYTIVGVGDFDAAGHSEVLWEDKATGDTGYWTTSGGQVTGFDDLGNGSTAYTIVGVGDFDNSGHDEVLWEDKANGDTGYWTTSSGHVTGFHDFGFGSTAYNVVGVGDYDGSGHAEVLWENPTTGDTGYWLTNAAGQVTGFHDLAGGSTSYQIVPT